MKPRLNRRFVLLSGLALGASLLVQGCETPVETQRLPDITFAHLPVFNIAVAKIEVVSNFKAPVKEPHIEHRLPTSPETALRQWAKDRLKPAGDSGTLRVLIEDASATVTDLSRDTSFKGSFTKQQSQRYDAKVHAVLSLIDGGGHERGTATAMATRSITVREDINLNDRERTQFELVDKLLADFNGQMDANIRQHLAPWLR